MSFNTGVLDTPSALGGSKVWDVVSLLDGSPYRPPDWRSRVARLCASLPSDQLKKLKVDKYIKQLIRFNQYLSKKLEDGTPLLLFAEDLVKKFPELGKLASLMYNEHGREVIHDLECFILARASDEQILEKFHITQEQLDTFRACYFDIADKLGNQHYIVHYVIFNKDKYNFVDTQAIAKFLCYFNGLDAFYFVRHKSGLSKYVYSGGGVQDSDPDMVVNTFRWKAHFLLESITSLDDFVKLVKVAKDLFVTDEQANLSAENILVLLSNKLGFQLKVKSDQRYLEGDPEALKLTEEVYNGKIV